MEKKIIWSQHCAPTCPACGNPGRSRRSKAYNTTAPAGRQKARGPGAIRNNTRTHAAPANNIRVHKNVCFSFRPVSRTRCSPGPPYRSAHAIPPSCIRRGRHYDVSGYTNAGTNYNIVEYYSFRFVTLIFTHRVKERKKTRRRPDVVVRFNCAPGVMHRPNVETSVTQGTCVETRGR